MNKIATKLKSLFNTIVELKEQELRNKGFMK